MSYSQLVETQVTPVTKSGKKMGRPKVNIDWSIVENLLKIQCTGEEVAAGLGIGYSTMANRCHEDHGVTFEEWSRGKRQAGNISLRRAQWEKAVKDKNPMMQKHLGIQYLGQADKSKQEVTSPDGSMTPVTAGVALYQLPDNGRDGKLDPVQDPDVDGDREDEF